MKDFDLKVLNEKLNTLDFNTNENTSFIKENFSDLFKGSNFTVEKAKAFIKSEEKNLLEENLKLHRNLQTTSEQINKAFELSFKKNNEQVLKYHKTAELNISLKQNDLRELKSEINKQIKDEEKDFNDKIINVQKVYEDELAEINKEIQNYKNQSNIETMRLEKEFDEKIDAIEDKYNEQILLINNEIQTLKVANIEKMQHLESDLKQETESKDFSYLTIKKTHNTSSITLNNFINEIKKRYDEELKKLDQAYNNTINDLKIEIEDLRDYHETAKDTIIEEHNEKLNALNVVFDVQKSAHNTANDEIIKNYNNEISKINADLRATKDNINLQIERLELEKLSKTKDLTNILEIDKINRIYNREINKINKKLLQLISKNDQDILTAEFVFQANLFTHDSTNIKHLNEWRHIKNIYDKERELDYNTAVKKIEIELFNLTEKEKLVNLEYKLNKENLNANLEIELLPIESQLYLASLLQNRDINLLNIEFDSFRLNNELETTVYKKELKLKLSKLENELIILKENYLYNKKLLTLVNQLDVEKALIQRDTNLEELNYQVRLQEYLLELNTTRLTNDFENFKQDKKLKLDKQTLEFDYFRKSEKKRAFIEQNKRSTIIDEIKNKNQRTLNTLRNQRNINITKNEAEMHEQINIYYLDYVLGLFSNQEKSFNYLLSLMKEPVNPSLTRDILKLLKEYNEYLLNDFKKAISDYLSYNKYHFNLIITSNTNNKYQLRHENILDDYNDSIKIISDNRKSINQRINTLIEDNKILELELSQNTIQLEQLAQINSDIALVNDLKNNNRRLSRNLKNNEKLIKNLYKQRKPLEQSILERTKIKESEEAKLQKSKQLEHKKYLNTIKRYETDFNMIGEYITNLINDLNNYYLQIENNTYLNDQTLNQLVKRINKLFSKINEYIIKHFTKLLNFWLKNYINTKTLNEKIINTFNLSTERALIKINKNYEKFIKYETKEKIALESIYKNKLDSIKNDLTKLNETMNQTRKSSNDLYNIKYEAINQSISDLKNKSERKQKLINENLHYANNEYKRQLLKTINNAKNTLKKTETKLLQGISHNKKEIELNITRTNQRADVIINRFNNERTKHLKNMNFERERFLSLINKNNELIEKESINLTTNIKLNAKKTQQTINHYKVQLKQFRRNSLKEKRHTIRKETKVLKKNYRFKRKEIYYHAKKA